MKKIILLTAALYWFGFAKGQIVSMSDTLSEFIVSATRDSVNLFNVSRDAQIISKSNLEKSTDEPGSLINSIPGIFCFGTHLNPGMNQTVFTRFSGSEQTAVLIDGIRINDPSGINEAADFGEFNVNDMSQIEVVKGAHSTLYGNAAQGGVINFISDQQFHDGINSVLNVGTGVFGKQTFYLKLNGSLIYKWKNGFYFGGSATQNNFIGNDATIDTITNIKAFKSFDTDNFSQTIYHGCTGFSGGKVEAHVNVWVSNRQTDFDKQGFKYNDPYGPNPDAWYDGDHNTITFNRIISVYNFTYHIHPKWSVSLNGGITSMSREVFSDSSIIDLSGNYDGTSSHDLYSGQQSTEELLLNFENKAIKIIAGTGISFERMNAQNDYYSRSFFGVYEIHNNLDTLNISSTISHAFIQAEVDGKKLSKVFSKSKTIVGIRLSNHSIFSNTISYELNPSWQINSTSLAYGCYSTGFSSPSLYQMYSPETYYTSNISRGNKNLKPEISNNFEIGFRKKINSLTLSFNLFYNRTNQVIEYVYLWNPSVLIDSLTTDFNRDDFRGDTYVNAGKQITTGGTFLLEGNLFPKLEFASSLTLGKGKLYYSNSDFDTTHSGGNQIQFISNGAFLSSADSDNELVRRPATATASINYSVNNKFQIFASCFYTGTYYDVFYNSGILPYGALQNTLIPNRIDFNSGITCQISSEFFVVLSCNNLLNEKKTELNGFTTTGRTFNLKLNYKL